jgi:hypothetical protein
MIILNDIIHSNTITVLRCITVVWKIFRLIFAERTTLVPRWRGLGVDFKTYNIPIYAISIAAFLLQNLFIFDIKKAVSSTETASFKTKNDDLLFEIKNFSAVPIFG